MQQPDTTDFKPYIAPGDLSVKEFTLRAILLGSMFGVLFGAATVYLALKAGLTVSASIPIAVLAISLGRKFLGNHDSRKQHHSNDRFSGRIGGRRGGIHPACLFVFERWHWQRIFQLLDYPDARHFRRYSGRPDDDSAA